MKLGVMNITELGDLVKLVNANNDLINESLKALTKSNRRLKAFALVASLYVLGLNDLRKEQAKKIAALEQDIKELKELKGE